MSVNEVAGSAPPVRIPDGVLPARPLRTREVSEATGVPQPTLRYWRHQGIGPASYRLGGSVVYDPGELAAWMAAQRGESLRGAATA